MNLVIAKIGQDYILFLIQKAVTLVGLLPHCSSSVNRFSTAEVAPLDHQNKLPQHWDLMSWTCLKISLKGEKRRSFSSLHINEFKKDKS